MLNKIKLFCLKVIKDINKIIINIGRLIYILWHYIKIYNKKVKNEVKELSDIIKKSKMKIKIKIKIKIKLKKLKIKLKLLKK